MQAVRVIAETAAWAVVGLTALLLVTQAVGWSRSMLVAVGQALTLVLAGLCALVTIFGRVWSNWPLTIAAPIVAATSVAVIAPALRRRIPSPGEPALSVLHANLLFENTRRNAALAAAVLGQDADVLAMSELHPRHEAALLADPGAARYSHRVHRAATDADGMLVWSRFPLADVVWRRTESRPTVIVTVCLPDGRAVRIVLAHNNPPTTRRGLRAWERSMVELHETATRPGPPTMIVADLNAARWHPPFRRLLGRGWRDAHELAGRGLSTSWPTSGPLPVPFVRLDHALVRDDLDVVGVRDLTVPGSDHRAFVVTLAIPDA